MDALSFPSMFMWVPRIELRLFGLNLQAASAFTLLSSRRPFKLIYNNDLYCSVETLTNLIENLTFCLQTTK